ncbi:hypothetical protein [Paenibacillus rigui]|uniref:Uncharacterized protein n=1 Tax=Paenibacillus rigui TaxID=554312 RepID=A0A229UN36_9BACL|nr:hypothetical protein [Paenibacillus rigui]OXM84820.1 hypothetical protein CF651_18085 [Paenibacillus rigui]
MTNKGGILFAKYDQFHLNQWISETLQSSQNNSLLPLDNPVYLEYWQLLITGLSFSLAVLLFLVIISYFKPWGKRGKPKPE